MGRRSTLQRKRATDAMIPLMIQIEETGRRVAESVAFERSPVRVGRNALNDLQLDEPFVSQWHAVIRLLDGRTTFLDLGATNPTRIDGRTVERNVEVEVTADSDVRIGSLRLHLIRSESLPDELFKRRRKSAFSSGSGGYQGGSEDLRTVAFVPAPGSSALPPGVPLSAVPAGASHGPPHSSAHSPGAGSPGPVADRVHALSMSGAASTRTDVGDNAHRRFSKPPPRNGAARVPESDPEPTSAESCDAAYRQYVASRAALLEHVRRRLAEVAASERVGVMRELRDRFPLLAHEPGLREVVEQSGMDPLQTGQPEMLDWLRRLTGGLFPPPGTCLNLAVAMERVGELLEVFSQGFIELRDTQRKFQHELDLCGPAGSGARGSTLDTSESPQAVLAYLLNDCAPGGQDRTDELARALAGFAVHQLALAGAVVEGGRSVLRALSSEAIVGINGRSTRGKWFRRGAAAEELWERYQQRHGDLQQEDRFIRVLFGREFARRYFAIQGDGGRG